MEQLINNFFDKSEYIYLAFYVLMIVLALVNLGLLLAGLWRIIRASAMSGVAAGAAGWTPPAEEVCPTCLKKLVDGECPDGHTIVRCSKCNTIMKDGVCPRCGVQGETEFCPTCNSELVDGECPRGHTIVRCPDCGAILQEGICPRGCNSDPLNLGWPGGTSKALSAFALKIVSPDKYKDFTIGVPPAFIVGRSAAEAKEAFVELLMTSKKDKAQCSRQYIRMDLAENGTEFKVTLLNSSRNPAIVDGEKLVMLNSSATAKLGSHIKLNPGYELEIVKNEQSESRKPDTPVSEKAADLDAATMSDGSLTIDATRTIN